ncbi:hypothetical protein PG993_005741 [Apiospora rasikravindrae]|uniref:DUF3669 domain-containing protein n=1 Tax=Apiospora rasikravindrae TaxID=990691 RepID=A0ABR1TBE8_9PEZI
MAFPPSYSNLHCIGAGACGSVWSTDYSDDDAATTISIAFKREDGAKGRSLFNDYHVHQSLIKALPRCPPDIRGAFQIPQCHGFLRPEEQSPSLLQRFPVEHQHPCIILVSQRIPPLGKKTRDLLCDRYCPPHFVDQIKADPRSVDCLIRPYLGLRRDPGKRQSKFQSFSLRNHVVSVDQMDNLGIATDTKEQYAAGMAKALAFLHWCARIDADDVEFVLAPPPSPNANQAEDTFPVTCFESDTLGRHCLWVLDFDRCKPLPMDAEGIALARRAFHRNDLYYPRPGRAHLEDQRLWAVFKRSFLDASASIIRSAGSVASDLPGHLPIRLMEAIESDVTGVATTEGQYHNFLTF